jgi:RimJ/RimL family protein N-acetyltransferase
MQTESGAAVLETATPQVEGMAVGQHVLLRAVKEEDLATLAQLLTENPGQRPPRLWTEQYLKKQHGREKEPGMWSERERYYVAQRRGADEIVGYVRHSIDGSAGDMYIVFHIGDQVADRDVLGSEMLRIYLEHAAAWFPRHRIGAETVSVETAKDGWLTAAGFVHEFDMERYFLYRGEPVAVRLWAWLREEN